jgi:hypothetical protein
MSEHIQKLQQDLLALPVDERLRMARWLIATAIELEPAADGKTADQSSTVNGLLALAGRFTGGSGNTSERAEEILESEVDTMSGLSVR